MSARTLADVLTGAAHSLCIERWCRRAGERLWQGTQHGVEAHAAEIEDLVAALDPADRDALEVGLLLDTVMTHDVGQVTLTCWPAAHDRGRCMATANGDRITFGPTPADALTALLTKLEDRP